VFHFYELCTMSNFNFNFTVSSTGTVAVVHNPNLVGDRMTARQVNVANTNFFKVAWDSNGYPTQPNSCGNTASCSSYNGVECICDITIQESAVFTSIPSTWTVISQLHVGGVDVLSSDEYTQAASSSTVKVYHKNGGYDKDTVFKALYLGEDTYFRNVRSTVQIDGTSFSFRNPPQFMNLALHEPRDAMYETEAVLTHYFRHPNVAPFLSTRMIKRFGISNPSPDYIEAVATAFKTGSYSNGGQSFGDSRYGNLEAMVAAIVLESEARTVLLDADPTAGSLREPTIKLISFMRAMEFEKEADIPELQLVDLQQKIGQGPHSIPNVFSYFLPEYAAPGHIKAAQLTSPEAQTMSGPKLISFLNGIFSLVDLGLNDCFGGFGGTFA